MASRRSRSELVMFSADDPTQVVSWLCDKFGLQAVLSAVSEYRPQAQAPTKRAYKKSGKKRASKKGAKKGGKKGGKRGRPAGKKAAKQATES